jgi:hypothetical protein
VITPEDMSHYLGSKQLFGEKITLPELPSACANPILDPAGGDHFARANTFA